MRTAAWAFAPLAACHGASFGFAGAALVFGIDSRGAALLLPMCGGGTVSIVSTCTHTAAMLAFTAMLVLFVRGLSRVRAQPSPAFFAPWRNNASPSGAKSNAASRSSTR